MKRRSRLCSWFLASVNFLLFSAVSLVMSGKNYSLQPLEITPSLFLYFSLAADNTCSLSKERRNRMIMGLGGWCSSGIGIGARCTRCSCVLSKSIPRFSEIIFFAQSVRFLPSSFSFRRAADFGVCLCWQRLQWPGVVPHTF